MRGKTPLFFLALALIFAAAAAWGSHRWLAAQAQASAPVQPPSVPVVVAATDLPAGEPLDTGDLAVQHWPLGSQPMGHLSRPEALKGRVLKGPLVKGEVVLAAKLAPEGLAGGLSAVVPAGYRAMTVRVDEVIGVGGFVQPGDRVDVLVTVEKGPFRDNPASRQVLNNVPVLTVGEKIQEEGEGAKPKRRKVTVVTLQVLPAEGERLALAASEGKVILALRNQADQDRQDTKGVLLTALVPPPLTAAPQPPPAAAAAPANPEPSIEIIKGVNRSQQTLGQGRKPVETALAKVEPSPAEEPAGEPPCAKKWAQPR